jgi:uncharacterized membrane protein (UPF0127 family)
MTRPGASFAAVWLLLWAGTTAAAEWVTLSIRGYAVRAELAVTPAERTRGLMHRARLPAGEGMLFVFETPAIQGMWMANTIIPLSVAFIDSQGIIINIADMEPLSERLHSSTAPAAYALEVNRGWFAARGIGPGDRVEGLEAAARRVRERK